MKTVFDNAFLDVVKLGEPSLIMHFHGRCHYMNYPWIWIIMGGYYTPTVLEKGFFKDNATASKNR